MSCSDMLRCEGTVWLWRVKALGPEDFWSREWRAIRCEVSNELTGRGRGRGDEAGLRVSMVGTLGKDVEAQTVRLEKGVPLKFGAVWTLRTMAWQMRGSQSPLQMGRKCANSYRYTKNAWKREFKRLAPCVKTL